MNPLDWMGYEKDFQKLSILIVHGEPCNSNDSYYPTAIIRDGHRPDCPSCGKMLHPYEYVSGALTSFHASYCEGNGCYQSDDSKSAAGSPTYIYPRNIEGEALLIRVEERLADFSAKHQIKDLIRDGGIVDAKQHEALINEAVADEELLNALNRHIGYSGKGPTALDLPARDLTPEELIKWEPVIAALKAHRWACFQKAVLEVTGDDLDNL